MHFCVSWSNANNQFKDTWAVDLHYSKIPSKLNTVLVFSYNNNWAVNVTQSNFISSQIKIRYITTKQIVTWIFLFLCIHKKSTGTLMCWFKTGFFWVVVPLSIVKSGHFMKISTFGHQLQFFFYLSPHWLKTNKLKYPFWTSVNNFSILKIIHFPQHFMWWKFSLP